MLTNLDILDKFLRLILVEYQLLLLFVQFLPNGEQLAAGLVFAWHNIDSCS